MHSSALYSAATVLMLRVVRVDEDGLWVCVADDTNAGIALELGESRFELGAEI